MTWLWFLAGIVVGLAFGMVVTCAIIIDSKMNDLEEK